MYSIFESFTYYESYWLKLWVLPEHEYLQCWYSRLAYSIIAFSDNGLYMSLLKNTLKTVVLTAFIFWCCVHSYLSDILRLALSLKTYFVNTQFTKQKWSVIIVGIGTLSLCISLRSQWGDVCCWLHKEGLIGNAKTEDIFSYSDHDSLEFGILHGRSVREDWTSGEPTLTTLWT